jgi:hypothetical protein
MAHAEDPQLARGKYLVQHQWMQRLPHARVSVGKAGHAALPGGSDVGFEVPQLGVFVAPNLTPDKNTGLGNWTKQQIVTTLRTGVRPDGRVLAPPMPWRAYASLTDAIVDFLKGLTPVAHKVPGPFGPSEKLTVPRMVVLQPKGEAAQQ